MGVLSEGLAISYGYEGQVKIQQAITELRTEGPSSIGPLLDKIMPEVLAAGGNAVDGTKIRMLVDPIIAEVRSLV